MTKSEYILIINMNIALREKMQMRMLLIYVLNKYTVNKLIIIISLIFSFFVVHFNDVGCHWEY